MKTARCIVAHPDDCIIFGWRFIRKYSHLRWAITFLTYTESDPRAKEISDFWKKYDISCYFLGYEDNMRDLVNKEILTFDPTEASADIQRSCDDVDILLTHGHDGEYGHPHHILVADSVTHPNIVRFSNPPNDEIITMDYDFNMSMLPLHHEVIRGCDRGVSSYRWCNK